MKHGWKILQFDEFPAEKTSIVMLWMFQPTTLNDTGGYCKKWAKLTLRLWGFVKMGYTPKTAIFIGTIVTNIEKP